MTRTLTRMTSWAGEEWGAGLWSFFPAVGTRLGLGAFREHRLSLVSDLHPTMATVTRGTAPGSLPLHSTVVLQTSPGVSSSDIGPGGVW